MINNELRDFNLYPRSESNRDRQNRNLKFYPLNYRGIRLGNAKLVSFCGNANFNRSAAETAGRKTYRAAMHSISTRAPFGRVFTATALRAGKGAEKNWA